MNKNVIIHTESDDNYLCHWKYIRRYRKNGHWVYVYNDKKLNDLREQQLSNMNRIGALENQVRSDMLSDRAHDRRKDKIEELYKNGQLSDEFMEEYTYNGDSYESKAREDMRRLRKAKYTAKETNKMAKKRKASKSVALGNKVAELLTSGSEKISKGKEYLKKLVK